jgi:Icc-related predicted phosphoesterase
MKILAIGDFHGKLPGKLIREAEKADLVISAGDFANADKIRKIIFRNWAMKWFEVIGVRDAKKLERDSYNSGLEIMKKLNKIGKKVYFVWGNSDFYKEYSTSEPLSIMPGFFDDKLKNLKNLELVDKKMRKINSVEIIGSGGYVDVTEFIKNSVDKRKDKQRKRKARYDQDARNLGKLFGKKKPKPGFIFLTHYTPYKCLDKVNFKDSPMNGKYVGWEPYNKIILKYKPALVICGHMHENQGKCKIGNSIVINPGAAGEGRAAVIEFDEVGRRVISVEFLK